MKIVKKIKQVGSGILDYARQSSDANKDADENLRNSNSYSKVSNQDNINMVSEETKRLKRERNISLSNSIRSKLGK